MEIKVRESNIIEVYLQTQPPSEPELYLKAKDIKHIDIINEAIKKTFIGTINGTISATKN